MIAAAALWLVVPAIAPFDAKAYPAPRALPAGLRAMKFENRDGVPWMCVVPRRCVPAPAAFAGWFGEVGADRRTVRVVVRAARAPGRRRRQRVGEASAVAERGGRRRPRRQAWPRARDAARLARPARPGGGVGDEIGGPKLDRMWRLSRYEERPGWTLQLQITFWGLPDDATRAALRAAFVDTQLGATPPSAKLIPRR